MFLKVKIFDFSRKTKKKSRKMDIFLKKIDRFCKIFACGATYIHPAALRDI
jgi:hypothetical protein